MPSSVISVTGHTLNRKLRNQLECPICFDTCKPPIYMCENGHTVCAKCQPRLNECGTCRSPGKPNLRCVQLEKIAELVGSPCEFGCGVVCNNANMAGHLQKCERGYSCNVCKTWRGAFGDLKHHVSTAHESQFVNLPRSGVKTIDAGLNCSQDTDMMISLNGTLFWLAFRSTATDRVVSCTMRLVSHSPVDPQQRLYFKVGFAAREGKLKVSYQAQVLNLTEDASKDHTDFSIPAGIIDSYEDKLVAFTLLISNPNPSAASEFIKILIKMRFFMTLIAKIFMVLLGSFFMMLLLLILRFIIQEILSLLGSIFQEILSLLGSIFLVVSAVALLGYFTLRNARSHFVRSATEQSPNQSQ